eukprot:10138991-Lingulodinium_polyedra.AAC.1
MVLAAICHVPPAQVNAHGLEESMVAVLHAEADSAILPWAQANLSSCQYALAAGCRRRDSIACARVQQPLRDGEHNT